MSASATTDAFEAPNADIAFSGEYVEQSHFSTRGRMGVFSYLAQSFVVSLLWTIAAFAAVFLCGAIIGENAAIVVAGLVSLPFLFVSVCMFIKRLHDLHLSGWFGLLVLIPIVNGLFLVYAAFCPGKSAANKFGAQRETKAWEKVVGGIYVALMVLAVVGGIAAGVMGTFS